MKEGVPGMSLANAGGGSCERYRATGVIVIMGLMAILFHKIALHNYPTIFDGPPLLS